MSNNKIVHCKSTCIGPSFVFLFGKKRIDEDVRVIHIFYHIHIFILLMPKCDMVINMVIILFFPVCIRNIFQGIQPFVIFWDRHNRITFFFFLLWANSSLLALTQMAKAYWQSPKWIPCTRCFIQTKRESTNFLLVEIISNSIAKSWHSWHRFCMLLIDASIFNFLAFFIYLRQCVSAHFSWHLVYIIELGGDPGSKSMRVFH